MTPATEPRMLVLLCAHDGAAHLPQQLASLAAQTLPPHAVVLHDWGSRDATPELLRGFAEARSGVEWHRHAETPGPAASYLRALRAALAGGRDFDYLCFCDQDDFWHPDKLARLAGAIRGQRWPDLLFSDVRVVEEHGAVRWPSLFAAPARFRAPPDARAASALFFNAVPGMAMAASREFLARCRPLWEQDGWVMHDWMLIAAAQALEARVHFLPDALVDYRQHRFNRVGAEPSSLRARGLRGVRKHVRAVRRQYELLHRVLQRRLPGALAVRWRMAKALWREPCLPVASRARMILGYWLLW